MGVDYTNLELHDGKDVRYCDTKQAAGSKVPLCLCLETIFVLVYCIPSDTLK